MAFSYGIQQVSNSLFFSDVRAADTRERNVTLMAYSTRNSVGTRDVLLWVSLRNLPTLHHPQIPKFYITKATFAQNTNPGVIGPPNRKQHMGISNFA